jgi:hypothetical protein
MKARKLEDLLMVSWRNIAISLIDRVVNENRKKPNRSPQSAVRRKQGPNRADERQQRAGGSLKPRLA